MPKEPAARDQPNSPSTGSMYSPKDQNEVPLMTAIRATPATTTHQPK